jgi:hypothetical protein
MTINNHAHHRQQHRTHHLPTVKAAFHLCARGKSRRYERERQGGRTRWVCSDSVRDKELSVRHSARDGSAMPARSRGPTAATVQRRVEVLRLRSQQFTFAEIGQQLGITGQRCGAIYRKVLAERVDLSVDEHRAEQADLIDEAICELRAIANGPKAGLRYKIDSWLAIVRFLERKAKLYGLDEPTKTEVLTITGIDAEIAKLEQELGRTTP